MFGAPCLFSDYTAAAHSETYVEVAPQENPNFKLQRLENDVAIQVQYKVVHSYMCKCMFCCGENCCTSANVHMIICI